MSQAKTNKLYRTFLKGLVTEASPLTFPPDTSYDEDNCLIFVAGNRSRRLGIDFEEDYAFSDYGLSEDNAVNHALIEYVWRNVQDVEGLDFLCHQSGNKVYFYNCSGTPVSANQKSFSVDLSLYTVAGYVGAETVPVQMISGKGYLFIASSCINPLIVEYDPLTDTISVDTIEILIRDFDGVDDTLAVDEEPTTLSNEHKYNLMNQGWVATATQTVSSPTLFGKFRQLTPPNTTTTVDIIQKYKTVIGKYPGNNKQWFLGKVEIEADGYRPGDFNPTLLNKVHVGNSRAPRGHFIYSAFNKDRSAVSGIPGLAVAQEATRPSTIAFASGRIFYGHTNNVYFSQILSEKHKAGLCFQDNDPTAEDLSDLLDNDGGVIPIPVADKIVLTKEVSNGIMVFANNGVWLISGGEKGFSATDYQITKVSAIGTDAPHSIVDTENHIYWWSKTGIQRLEQQQGMFGSTGAFTSVNLTENTIDRLIKDIPATLRKYVKGAFDYGTNTVHWLYADAVVGKSYFYNKFINFNIVTESFFPWSLPSESFPYVTGLYVTSDINRIDNDQIIYVDSDVVYVNSEEVIIEGTQLSAKDSFINYVVAYSNVSTYFFTMGNFTNDNYVDWEKWDDEGSEYNSFVETGYEILDDATRNKAIIYLQPFFRQTEENFIPDGDDYTLDQQSSCYLTTKWDWSNTSASNKWSTKIQAYRLQRVPPVDPSNLSLNTGFKIVTTKNKIRGTGRAIQFRFECSEANRNFDLLGWQVFYTGVTEA